MDEKANYLRWKKKAFRIQNVKRKRTHWCFLLFLDKIPFQRKHKNISMGLYAKVR